MSGNQNSDPRQPSTAKPYKPPAISSQDIPPGYSSFLAIMFGVAGVMLRYKLGSWLAIICCAQSLANMKNVEADLKQVIMAMTFAIMGLMSNYFGASRQAQVQS
uniref:Protein Asterix n=1 Tax=Araucaria cunninghamii TaxID=56994 RepID=A0A0D6QRQ4_ARACU